MNSRRINRAAQVHFYSLTAIQASTDRSPAVPETSMRETGVIGLPQAQQLSERSPPMHPFNAETMRHQGLRRALHRQCAGGVLASRAANPSTPINITVSTPTFRSRLCCADDSETVGISQ